MRELKIEERQALTEAMMWLMEQWGVDGSGQISLLGLPTGTRTRHLKRFQEGEPLPDDPKVVDHCMDLLAIHEALRTTYPLNPMMGAHWMRTPHRRFDNRTPLGMMLERGRDGIADVLSHLDCSYSWDQTDSVDSYRTAADQRIGQSSLQMEQRATS